MLLVQFSTDLKKSVQQSDIVFICVGTPTKKNEAAADLKERQDAVRETRRAAYGSIEDQMDMQYKDNINSTTTWKDHVAAVKSANPIPTE